MVSPYDQAQVLENQWRDERRLQNQIVGLSEATDEGAVEKIIPFLSSTPVRRHALWALGRLGSKANKALPALQKLSQLEIAENGPREATAVVEVIAGCAPNRMFSGTWNWAREAKWRINPGVMGPAYALRNSIQIIDESEDMNQAWAALGEHPSCLPNIDFSKEFVVVLVDRVNAHFGYSGIGEIAKNGDRYQIPYSSWYSDVGRMENPPGFWYYLVRYVRPEAKAKIHLFDPECEKPRKAKWSPRSCPSVDYRLKL